MDAYNTLPKPSQDEVDQCIAAISSHWSIADVINAIPLALRPRKNRVAETDARNLGLVFLRELSELASWTIGRMDEVSATWKSYVKTRQRRARNKGHNYIQIEDIMLCKKKFKSKEPTPAPTTVQLAQLVKPQSSNGSKRKREEVEGAEGNNEESQEHHYVTPPPMGEQRVREQNTRSKRRKGNGTLSYETQRTPPSLPADNQIQFQKSEDHRPSKVKLPEPWIGTRLEEQLELQESQPRELESIKGPRLQKAFRHPAMRLAGQKDSLSTHSAPWDLKAPHRYPEAAGDAPPIYEHHKSGSVDYPRRLPVDVTDRILAMRLPNNQPIKDLHHQPINNLLEQVESRSLRPARLNKRQITRPQYLINSQHFEGATSRGHAHIQQPTAQHPNIAPDPISQIQPGQQAPVQPLLQKASVPQVRDARFALYQPPAPRAHRHPRDIFILERNEQLRLLRIRHAEMAARTEMYGLEYDIAEMEMEIDE